MTAPTHETYFNLHKQCLSYRPMGGKVAHANTLHMTDVIFVVQPAGRERVLRERRKNVHAYVRGTVVSADTSEVPSGDGWVRVRYNPYDSDMFHRLDTGAPVTSASEVILIGKHVYARADGLR